MDRFGLVLLFSLIIVPLSACVPVSERLNGSVSSRPTATGYSPGVPLGADSTRRPLSNPPTLANTVRWSNQSANSSPHLTLAGTSGHSSHLGNASPLAVTEQKPAELPERSQTGAGVGGEVGTPPAVYSATSIQTMEPLGQSDAANSDENSDRREDPRKESDRRDENSDRRTGGGRTRGGAKPDRRICPTPSVLAAKRLGGTELETEQATAQLISYQAPLPGQTNLEAQPTTLGDSQIMIPIEPLMKPVADPFPPYAQSSLLPSDAPPIFRTWSINHFWTNSTIATTIERHQLLFPKEYYHPFWQFTGDVYADATNFYSAGNLFKLGIGLGIGAVLANTNLDQDFRDWYQQDVVQDANQFHWAKYLGEGEIVVPVVVGSWLIGDWFAKNNSRGENSVVYKVARWGERSFRSFGVGFIPMVTLQVLTGASRPNEVPHGSQWKPFIDNNGVSGHSFTGAVPFIVAAKMSESPLLKGAFYFGSILAGYSRIHDDAHFLSQVMLGWLIAELSAQSVFKSESHNLGYRIVPLDILGHYGFGVEFRR